MKRETPLISVIIPVYNVESLIRRCIDSILDLNYQNWELILINDGSMDKSEDICLEYLKRDERIRYFYHKNSGVSYTRNRGILLSKGKYICFVDSDDWVKNDYLNNFFPLPTNDFLCVQGIQYYLPDKENPVIKFKYSQQLIEFNEDSSSKIIDSDILSNGCPVAKLFVRDIIVNNNIYFDEKLSINEDHVFFLKYCNYIKSIYLSSNVSYWYYFDYKLPSLTKKKHSVNELLLASQLLLQELSKIVHKININDSEYLKHIYSNLGLNQIIKAGQNANSYKEILEAYYKWKEMKLFTPYYKHSGFWGLVFSNLFNKNMTKSAFVFSVISSYYLNFRKTMVFLVKKWLLRK